ncbi:uncharacterized protein [Anolis sagrei]|uniref:uncharacterized protein isoform X2 n=1 Tax=Anolis sagrei TaxID=38937 RepID=UPI00351FAF48
MEQVSFFCFDNSDKREMIVFFLLKFTISSFFISPLHIISLIREVFLTTFSLVPSSSSPLPAPSFLLPFLSLSVTASSSVVFPSTGTSSLSCVGSAPPPSPTSPQPDIWSSTDFATVMLMPPFLRDQVQHVNAHSTFLLFCQATGPRDAHFVWKKNGRKIEACINEQSHVLADGRLHLLSWVKDAIAQDSEYCCLAVSKSGNKTSTSYITVEGNNFQDSWSREFASWRSVVTEHDKMMESWKKTWESCNKKVTV